MPTELLYTIILESVLIVAAIIAFIVFKKFQMKKRLVQGALSDMDQSVIRNLLLDDQISRVQRHLQVLEDNKAEYETRHLYQKWLQWLQAEKQALDVAPSHTLKFWQQFESHARDLMEVFSSHEVSLTPVSLTDNGGDYTEMIAMLQKRVEAYEAQVRNLEKFRDMFFDVSKQVKSVQTEYDNLRQQLDSAIDSATDENDKQKLQELNNNLRKHNQQLERQFEKLKMEFDAVIAQTGLDFNEVESPAQSKPQIISTQHFEQFDSGISKIKNVVSAQTLEIAQMNKIIDGLQLELQQKEQLLAQTSAMSERNEEMSTVLEILEEENQFLQAELERVNKNIQAAGDVETKIDKLNQQLLAKDKSINQLQARYNDLESEYLELYQKLKGKKIA